MGLYIKTKTDFDFYSAELVFFYIDDFMVFKKQGFCFYPRYQISDYEYLRGDELFKIVLNTKKEFVDLFPDEKVNVKVLCGKNGCGKSTLLEVMAGTKLFKIEVMRFYLLKDKNNNFAASCKCNLMLDGDVLSLDTPNWLDFSPHNSCVNHKNMKIPDFEFRKNILKFYSENPLLYDGVINDELFTNFSVELWNFDNEIELLLSGLRKSLFKNENVFELKNWLKSDILSYFFLHNFQDNTYDEAAQHFEQLIEKKETDLYVFLNDFVYRKYAPQSVDEIREKQKEILFQPFLLSDLSEVEKKIAELEEKIFEFLQAFDDEMRNGRGIVTRLKDLTYFRGYSNKTLPNRYISDLSDGEWRAVKFRYEILHSMFQSEGLWWYIDEPEAYLHPEWCRTFIADYMMAYNSVKIYLQKLQKYNPDNKFNPDKRFTLVFATHSPFLLSDLTKDYIIYLEKQNGVTKEIQAEKECFAGNIGEMYNTNFFMQNTIGQFAYDKLKSIIETIDRNEDVDGTVLKNWKLLISKIGDDLLKNLLSDKVLRYEKNRTIGK